MIRKDNIASALLRVILTFHLLHCSFLQIWSSTFHQLGIDIARKEKQEKDSFERRSEGGRE